MRDALVIGVDFGTDSVRSVLIDASNGKEICSEIFYYPRWASGRFCDPRHSLFRQHPLDYVEGLHVTINHILSGLSRQEHLAVKGIGIDTTGSTPVAVDKQGTPLALHPEFEENPNAMFVLWKDHTAIQEAFEINTHAAKYETNYLQYVGGIYSSEWFWAKMLHIIREDKAVREKAYSWVEHCDWIPYLLTGGNDVQAMKRSRCAAGHKALWHRSFGGLPPNEFWSELDPLLNGIRSRLFEDCYTSDVPAGTLSKSWADRLGLHENVVVSVGAFDAHMGAVGGDIQPYSLSRIMGTSTCDILVAPTEDVGDHLVKGICGQVDGSVVPGMTGMEAGQSAFGDVYAWFRNLISWPMQNLMPEETPEKESIISEMYKQILPKLSEEAFKIPTQETQELALDWMNGRRTPDANQALKGAIVNLNLGSDAPRIYKALVESTCFGARAIVERFEEEGIHIKELIGLGGVAKKSPFAMQTLADVLNRPIKVARSEQTCALGAGMFAATAAGIYPDVLTAQSHMGHGFEREYFPNPENIDHFDKMYEDYMRLGNYIESNI